MDALRTRGAEDIKAEEQRIAAAAAADRERLLEQTRREIDLQVRLAKKEILEHAADLSVQLATERIKKEVTPADQDRAGRSLSLDQVKEELSMSLRTSANRYAKALFDVALEEKADLAQVDRDLDAVVAMMQREPGSGAGLEPRRVTDAARQSLMEAVAKAMAPDDAGDEDAGAAGRRAASSISFRISRPRIASACSRTRTSCAPK